MSENAETTIVKKHQRAVSAPQPIRRPDLPVVDELGFEAIDFDCFRCGRPGYMSKNYAEILQHHGRRLGCLACDRPDIYKWSVEVQPGGAKREYLSPRSDSEIRRLLTPEARLLSEKQGRLHSLKARRDALVELVANAEMEWTGLLDAIDALESETAELTVKVQSLDAGGLADKVRQAQTLKERILKLTAEIDAAKKANAPTMTKNPEVSR